jgi:glycogen operon protein
MHVDGFRFDLASALARELHGIDRLGAFLDIIHQDPVISQVVTAAASYSVADRSVAVFRLVDHPGDGGRV